MLSKIGMFMEDYGNLVQSSKNDLNQELESQSLRSSSLPSPFPRCFLGPPNSGEIVR